MRFLSIFFIFCFGVAFAQETVYKDLHGVWNANSNIRLHIDESGGSELSIIPSEFMSLEEQKEIVENHISTKGYFKVLEVTDIYTEVEILLNEEISTNYLDISPSHIYIFKDDNTEEGTWELFLTKENI